MESHYEGSTWSYTIYASDISDYSIRFLSFTDNKIDVLYRYTFPFTNYLKCCYNCPPALQKQVKQLPTTYLQQQHFTLHLAKCASSFPANAESGPRNWLLNTCESFGFVFRRIVDATITATVKLAAGHFLCPHQFSSIYYFRDGARD